VWFPQAIWGYRMGTIGLFFYCARDPLPVGSHLEEEIVECYQGPPPNPQPESEGPPLIPTWPTT